MKISVETIGDLQRKMQQEIVAGEWAVKRSIHKAGLRLKDRWRAQIMQAGLGQHLARTIREQTYPEGHPSLDAASLIWTKEPKILEAHIKGALIRSKRGLWLAIPTPAAGRDGYGHRITPGKWERMHGMQLRFIFRRGKPGLLVADDARLKKSGTARANRRKRRKDGILTGALTVPIFILVPQVRLKKRLDLAALIHDTSGLTPYDIVADWENTIRD